MQLFASRKKSDAESSRKKHTKHTPFKLKIVYQKGWYKVI
ncbi:hypothetical protein [Candidatus Coxiella mudrowiae]